MKILFIGDVVGSPARDMLERELPKLKKEEQIQLVIANGENAAHGRGITEKVYKWFMEQGISVVTMGNHTWDNRAIFDFLDDADKLVVPANYPKTTPGRGVVTFQYNALKVSVISLMGTVFMSGPLGNPFETIDDILTSLDSDIIIVDIHAEATSEKIALGYYLDGRVTAVVGTHTHVPTLDARILPKGTAYQTDVGMNGCINGVIGVQPKEVIDRFLTGLPNRFVVQTEGPVQLNGLIIEVEKNKVIDVKMINKLYENGIEIKR